MHLFSCLIPLYISLQISALLITLAVFDILFLLCSIPVFSLQAIGGFYMYLNICYPLGEWDRLLHMSNGVYYFIAYNTYTPYATVYKAQVRPAHCKPR